MIDPNNIEELLEYSEEKYRALFDNAPFAIGIVDMEGRIVDINYYHESNGGFEKKDLIGKKFIETGVIPKNYEKVFIDVFKELVKGNTPEPKEVQIYNKKGDLIWVKIQCSFIKLGKEKLIQVITQDITEKKKTEQKLKESKFRYINFIENFHGIAFQGYQDFSIGFFHGAIEEITGYAKNAFLLGKIKWDQIIHPDDLTQYKNNIKQFHSSSKTSNSREYRIIRKNGDLRWVTETIQKFYDDKTNMEGVRGTIIDITERMNSEKKLKESEERYRLITENITDMVAIITGDFVIEHINESIHKKYLGYSKDDLLGKKSLDLIHPDDLKNILHLYKKELEVGEGRAELRYKKKNGDYIWLEIQGKKFIDIDGNEKFLAVSRDISEKKTMEQSLKKSQDEKLFILNNIPALIAFQDREHNILYANKAAGDSVNKSAEELLGRKCYEIWNIRREPCENCPVHATLISGKGELKEMTTPDGRIWQIRGFPVKDDNENIIGAIEVTAEITKRKKAEQRLKESEIKYKNLFDNFPIGIFLFDDSGNLLEGNTKVYNSFSGYPPDQSIGKSFLEIISLFKNSDELSKIFKNRAMERANGKELKPIELKLVRQDGKELWIYWHSIVLKLKNKSIIQAVVQDITERKKFDQMLRESEEKFRTLYENIAGGTLIISDDYIIRDVNERTCEITGYKKEELIGKLCDIVCPKGSASKSCPIWEGEKEGFKGMDTAIKCKDGRKNPILKNAKRILFEGKIHILENFQDISERKNAEIKLKESEEKYRSLYENSINAIILLDFNGKIIDCNSATEKICGYTKDDIIGQNYLKLPFYPKSMIKVLKERFQAISKELDLKSQELQIKRKDGNFAWVKTKISYIKIGNQNYLQVLVQDITEQKNAEEKLRESEKKYRKIFESIPDLFFLVSNDSTILDYNASSEIDFYVPPEKFMNVKLIDFFSQEIREKTLVKINDVLELKKPQILEYSIPINDKTRFFEARFLFFSKNKILIFIRDITDKKESEKGILEHAKKLEILNQIIIAGNKTEDLTSLLEDILTQTLKLLNFSGGGIYLVNKTKKIAELVCYKNLPIDFIEFVRLRKIDQEPNKTIFIKGEPIFSENYQIIEPLIVKKWGLLSIVSIPLFSKDEIIGALNIASKTRHKFTFQEKDILISIGREIGTVISKIKAEETIKEGEKFLSNIFTSIQDGMCILDKDYNIIQTNPTMEKWYSHKKPLTNLKCYQLFHDKNEPCEDCGCYHVIETGESCIKYIPRLGPKGNILGTLEIYTFAFYNQETGKISGIIEYIRDITNQYKTEEKLKQSEEKSRGILENIKEGYFEIDLQGNFTFYNDALHQILGYSEKELGGVNLNRIVDNQTNRELRQFFYNIFQTEIPQTSFQFEIRKGIMEKKVLETSGYLRYDTNKNKIGFCGLVRDITEAKKVEYMVKEEIRKLKELDLLKDEFMFRASHELKTPLNLVCSASSRLLESYKDKLTSKEKQLVEVINKGGERLEKLIKALLDLSQIETGKLELDKHNENISKILEGCINDTYYLIIERDLNLKMDIQKEIFTKVDKIRFEQVIFNLISNAIKYTPPKGTLSVNLKIQNGFIKIEIKDNGVGFTGDEIKKIFTKFGKIERYGKGMDIDSEGSGLGLYLSKKIVDAHNGVIWVESEGRNRGSSFIIKLPIN